MRATVANLAKFYDLHSNTVQKWKATRPVLYKAMVDYFMKSGDTKYE